MLIIKENLEKIFVIVLLSINFSISIMSNQEFTVEFKNETQHQLFIKCTGTMHNINPDKISRRFILDVNSTCQIGYNSALGRRNPTSLKELLTIIDNKIQTLKKKTLAKNQPDITVIIKAQSMSLYGLNLEPLYNYNGLELSLGKEIQKSRQKVSNISKEQIAELRIRLLNASKIIDEKKPQETMKFIGYWKLLGEYLQDNNLDQAKELVNTAQREAEII